MRRAKTPQGKKTASRTTISLTPLVWKWAQDSMGRKGYNNFTAYISELIRRDRERLEASGLGANPEDDSPPQKNNLSG